MEGANKVVIQSITTFESTKNTKNVILGYMSEGEGMFVLEININNTFWNTEQ